MREITIEDFVGADKLETMTPKEREIWQHAFNLNKEQIQSLMNVKEKMEELAKLYEEDGK